MQRKNLLSTTKIAVMTIQDFRTFHQHLPLPSAWRNFNSAICSKFTEDQIISLRKTLGKDVPIQLHVESVQENIPEDELVKITKTVSVKCLEEILSTSFSRLTLKDQKDCLDKLFKTVANCENVIRVEDFPSLAIKAMKMLREKRGNQINVLRAFAKCLGLRRPDSNEPLMPVDRKPFGLIQHQIQFFCASDIRQVSKPC